MKTKIVTVAVFTLTAVTIALYPMAKHVLANALPVIHPVVALALPPKITPVALPVTHVVNQRPKIEVVFVLDTTSSMSGLIETAKEKIWSIASSMASADTAPEIRMGLVAFRDRGDAYVTRVVDLSTDLDSVYATLMDFRAQGGGDGPESVNQALYDAVHGISWSQDPNSYKVVFLVGDAPPHMDYPNEVKYPETLSVAASRGITVNTIQSGQHGDTVKPWKEIASLSQGHYFQVDQAGSAVAIATPFDRQLAKVSKDLDATRLYHGTEEEKVKQRAKRDATAKLHKESSEAAQARRATFNASASGAGNFLGEKELVDEVASGRVDLSSIERDQLPEPMQAMSPAEQRIHIDTKAKKRQKLQQEIKDLARQRKSYLDQQVNKLEGADDSLDYRIFGAVREQAGKRGISYETKTPAL
ncbi:MAG: vWA domain-containing protein [Motiliproteus sp.]